MLEIMALYSSNESGIRDKSTPSPSSYSSSSFFPLKKGGRKKMTLYL